MTIFRHGGKTTTGQVFSSKFIAKWDTTQPGSANDTVVLPLVADGSYNFYIDWGDGNRDTITGYNQPEVTHQYSDTGIYTIRVVSNNMVGWQFNDSGDDDKLTEVINWGPLRFVSDDTNLFKGCSNLTLSTTSDPPFNADAAGMFQDCSSLTGNGGNILNWDMSAVTGMNFMLAGCTSLDPDLSNWDVSSIENAEGFMSGAGLSMSNYDRILSGWSSQSVQSGVNISFGDTKYSHVTGASYRDILTSAATGWIIIDGGAHLPPNPKFISTWNTRSSPYNNAPPNNQIILPLNNNGTYDFYVDWGDGTAEQHVTSYDSANAKHTYGTPGIYTIIITGTLIGWAYHLSQGGGQLRSDLTVNSWSTIQNMGSRLTSIHDWEGLYFLPNSNNHFYSNIGLTGVPTEMFNVPAEGSIRNSFYGLTGLGIALTNNNMISGWDTSPVTEMKQLFQYMAFNSPSPIDFDLSNWDASNVTGMGDMFLGNEDWNNGGSPGISGWDVSSCMDMSSMFSDTAFNQDIGAWDVGNVTRLNRMFRGNSAFNNGGSPSISGWDVSNAITMRLMFDGASSFNQPIGSWDVTNAGSGTSQAPGEAGNGFEYMFREAVAFNQDIGSWDMSNAITINNMFNGATGFQQNIGDWDVSNLNVSHAAFMANRNTDESRYPTANYNNLLIGWSTQDVNSLQINFGGAKYSAGAAASARQTLINKGWTIADGGQA